jgi:hypothetical protein
MTNDNKSETGQPSLPRTVGPAIAVGQERVAAAYGLEFVDGPLVAGELMR